MKQLKDYLHLYLGCDVIWAGSNLENLAISKLTGINVIGGEVLATLSHRETQFATTSTSKIKPILRQLSDMTEEEVTELMKILFSDIDDCIELEEIQVQLTKGDGGNMVDLDFELIIEVSCRCFEGQLGIRKCGSLMLFNEDGELERLSNVPEALIFLLSKHFDIFGLIESGLAIDKTTIK